MSKQPSVRPTKKIRFFKNTLDNWPSISNQNGTGSALLIDKKKKKLTMGKVYETIIFKTRNIEQQRTGIPGNGKHLRSAVRLPSAACFLEEFPGRGAGRRNAGGAWRSRVGEIDLGAQKAQRVDFTRPRTREERVTQRKSSEEGRWGPLEWCPEY